MGIRTEAYASAVDENAAAAGGGNVQCRFSTDGLAGEFFAEEDEFFRISRSIVRPYPVGFTEAGNRNVVHSLTPLFSDKFIVESNLHPFNINYKWLRIKSKDFFTNLFSLDWIEKILSAAAHCARRKTMPCLALHPPM